MGSGRTLRWSSPPGWPAPPPGWRPPPGWAPDPAWGPAPPGWAFWVPPRRSPVPLVAAGVVVLLLLVAVGAGVYLATRPIPTVALGVPVSDDDAEFTVTELECGLTELVRASGSSLDAQGQFCVLRMSVRATGDEDVFVAGGQQRLHDAAGRTHEFDGLASVVLESQEPGLASEYADPGQTLTGTLVFDVPVGARITQVELHGSFRGDGVRVDVG